MTLLRHTTADVVGRDALTVNPAKTCQPIGAMYAALGVHRCLPHSHGSQGCCAYHRSTLTRHYKEPVMAATSSFTEGAAVFGGQANLLQAIETIFTTYRPDVIAVHTTCLSETIGDDLAQIIAKARADGKIPEGKFVVHASTPSYVGSHVTGFAAMTRSLVTAFAEPAAERGPALTVIPGWVEPADMRELKRLFGLLGVPVTLVPDTSGVLDGVQDGTRRFYPEGGVRISQLRATGASRATLALGPAASGEAARALEAKCGVPCTILELPIGLRATDRLVTAVRTLTGCAVPPALAEERGRLVDLITDMHQYFYRRRVALWGDPDQLVSLAEFLVDLDMTPAYVVTGTPDRSFEERMAGALGAARETAVVRCGPGADLFLLHQHVKRAPVDLLLGNTYGKYIARDEGIPLVRHGFPILDRIGHQFFPTVGYRGAIRLLEKILDALMDHQDRTSPEESFELVM